MVRLLLTHGRGLSGRDHKRLRRKFTRSLREGLDKVGFHDIDDEQIDFLYYGDLLDRADEDTQPAIAALAEIGRGEGAESASCAFEEQLAHLHRHLDAVAARDSLVGVFVEQRAGHPPTVSDETDQAGRHTALEAALEERTTQLLENPSELLDVLEREFGSAYVDDDTVRGHLQELDERLGEDPRASAVRRAAAEEETEDPGRVETVLREWIIDPATDAIASLQAVSWVVREYGIDLRMRLGAWRAAAWSDALTRLEGTDFGRQWALLFDVIAVVANATMLDGVYIARRMADVELYFRNVAIRNVVRAHFRDALAGDEQPTILVAHSLGSVITYDVMREYEHLAVPGLVTLGSPLSVGHFRRNLAREGESGNNLPVPTMLERWVNVYSELDPLVLGSGIEAWFQGGGDAAGPGPVDREAENTGYLDAHSPDQYLRSQQTATAVMQMVTRAADR
jgi:hypothetical protein